MNADVEFHIRHNYTWAKLPASVKQAMGNSQKEYEKAVVTFSIRNQLRYKGNLEYQTGRKVVSLPAPFPHIRPWRNATHHLAESANLKQPPPAGSSLEDCDQRKALDCRGCVTWWSDRLLGVQDGYLSYLEVLPSGFVIFLGRSEPTAYRSKYWNCHKHDSVMCMLAILALACGVTAIHVTAQSTTRDLYRSGSGHLSAEGCTCNFLTYGRDSQQACSQSQRREPGDDEDSEDLKRQFRNLQRRFGGVETRVYDVQTKQFDLERRLLNNSLHTKDLEIFLHQELGLSRSEILNLKLEHQETIIKYLNTSAAAEKQSSSADQGYSSGDSEDLKRSFADLEDKVASLQRQLPSLEAKLEALNKLFSSGEIVSLNDEQGRQGRKLISLENRIVELEKLVEQQSAQLRQVKPLSDGPHCARARYSDTFFQAQLVCTGQGRRHRRHAPDNGHEARRLPAGSAGSRAGLDVRYNVTTVAAAPPRAEVREVGKALEEQVNAQAEQLEKLNQLNENLIVRLKDITDSYTRNNSGNIRDCYDLYQRGYRLNHVYTIPEDPYLKTPAIPVYCDMKTAEGGWTVFQRRFDGSVSFARSWIDYKNGFGRVTGEYWLGLNQIYRLSNQGHYKLRVDLEDWEGNKAYAIYSSFRVCEENEDFMLKLGGYSGTAGDSMSMNNGRSFTTKDRDNDAMEGNCAQRDGGGGGGHRVVGLEGGFLLLKVSVDEDQASLNQFRPDQTGNGAQFGLASTGGDCFDLSGE
ncbi:FAM91 N-terminus [Branchiostoma belcheri]|nr:FAM91 N-terminus [Branchiostoma belcheri]